MFWNTKRITFYEPKSYSFLQGLSRKIFIQCYRWYQYVH